MIEFLRRFFDTSDFPARWNCGNWDSFHGWLHITSDLAIWAAYGAIPMALVFYGWRKRREMKFAPILWLFAAFILSCGTTHLIDAIIFYNPIYRISGVMKMITAIVSWATVIAIIKFTPEALKLPGLKAANNRLADELDRRRRAEQTLTHAHEDLQSFTSMVTHDLRNPMSSALFMAEMAKESLASGSNDKIPEQLNLVVSSLRRMEESLAELHQQGLAFGRLDSERGISLNEVVVEAEKSLSAALVAGDAKVKVGGLPSINGRRPMLVHLFTNLIENAIKYRGSRPALIEIEGREGGGQTIVTVADNGRGVPPEDLEKIFEAEFRGENSGDQPGSGLGLSYCRRIMLAHGGRITAGAREGGGTVFTLVFEGMIG